MKLSSILISATGAVLLAGCNSLDNPVTNLFHGMGNDARVYNSQTGQWEYPPEKRQPKQKVAGAAATPGPQSFDDTRYWDSQRNQWVQTDPPRTKTPPKAKPTPPPADATDATTASQPTPPPAPPRPAQETGVYNASTGKIEWQTSDANVPHGAAPVEPKKRWYWPF